MLRTAHLAGPKGCTLLASSLQKATQSVFEETVFAEQMKEHVFDMYPGQLQGRIIDIVTTHAELSALDTSAIAEQLKRKEPLSEAQFAVLSQYIEKSKELKQSAINLREFLDDHVATICSVDEVNEGDRRVVEAALQFAPNLGKRVSISPPSPVAVTYARSESKSPPSYHEVTGESRVQTDGKGATAGATAGAAASAVAGAAQNITINFAGLPVPQFPELAQLLGPVAPVTSLPAGPTARELANKEQRALLDQAKAQAAAIDQSRKLKADQETAKRLAAEFSVAGEIDAQQTKYRQEREKLVNTLTTLLRNFENIHITNWIAQYAVRRNQVLALADVMPADVAGPMLRTVPELPNYECARALFLAREGTTTFELNYAHIFKTTLDKAKSYGITRAEYALEQRFVPDPLKDFAFSQGKGVYSGPIPAEFNQYFPAKDFFL